MKSYINTNKESGSTLKDLKEKANHQQRLILGLFKKQPDKSFTACDIESKLKYKVLLTSIRRAITNLTEAGYLNKTDVKRIGRYGKACYTWTVNE